MSLLLAWNLSHSHVGAFSAVDGCGNASGSGNVLPRELVDVTASSKRRRT
jgi:hypothetical protein